MKILQFSDYDDYIRAQITLTRKKVRRDTERHGEVRVFAHRAVVDAVRNHWIGQGREYLPSGLCHGVRAGAEIDMFEDRLGGDWIGTEITPDLCDGEKIVCWDFNRVRQEWIGEFDIIYSNSFDHSNDPYKTLKVWLSCLAPGGFLYLEWTRWHNKLGVGRNRADCFAATADEYKRLVKEAGRPQKTLRVKVPRRGRTDTRLIFVVQ